MFDGANNCLEAEPPYILKLREKIQSDVVLSEDSGKPNHFKSLSGGNTVLETDTEQARTRASTIVDQDMRSELDHSGASNWCRTAKPLVPLKTKGDGNCLLHAISLFLWGIQDEPMFLRRLLYITLCSDERDLIKRRWRNERGYVSENVPGLNLDTRDWEEEWDLVIKLGDDGLQNRLDDLPYSSLEEIHLFVMANILRRPIIVLCDPMFRSAVGHSIQPNNFGGIYLPLDWQPKQCWKHPIVLGYHMSHFAPLVSQKNSFQENYTSVQALHVVPLLHKDLTPLRLHFLLPGEEGRAMEWLNGFFKITEITLTRDDGVVNILAASLNVTPLPDDLNIDRLNTQYYQSGGNRDLPITKPTNFSANMIGIQQPEREEPNFALGMLEGRYYAGNCITVGCSMTGLPETKGMCSQCFADYSKRDAETEAEKRQMPRKPSAPLMKVDPLNEKNLISLQQPTEGPSHLYLKPTGQRNCAFELCKKPASSLGKLCRECLGTLRSVSSGQRSSPLAQSRTTDQEELFGNGNANTAPHPSFHEASTKCIVEGCQRTGKETQRNMCSSCFLNSKDFPLPLRTPEPVSEHQVMVQPVSERAPAKLVRSSQITSGNSDRAESETERQKHLCSKPGCEGQRANNSLELCTSCYLSTRRTPNRDLAAEPPTDLQLSTQGAGRIDSTPADDVREPECEQVEESYSESVSSPELIVSEEQRVKCVSPVCSNFVFPPKQLCDNCVETLTRAGVKQAKCRNEGCKFHGSPNFDGYCSKCYSDLQRMQGIKTKRPSTDPTRQASRSQEFSFPRNRVLDIESQQRAQSAPIMARGKACVVSNCTRFGDPSMESMCTRCYQRKYPAPRGPTPGQPPFGALYMATPATVHAQARNAWPATSGLVPSGSVNPSIPPVYQRESEVNQFVTNMARLEAGQKSPKCLNSRRIGCLNYGSRSRQGYCTSCYDRLRGEDVVDSSRRVNTQVANMTLTF